MGLVSVGTQADADVDAKLSTGEVAKLAGVSFRQLDHWERNGVFGPPSGTGSGVYRRWDPEVVPVVRLLGRLSAAMSQPRSRRGVTGVATSVMRRVVENYAKGGVVLAPGLWLHWDVESDTLGP